ncbi:MAG: hypothetical protein JHC95_13650 [Solirubrobacteraceae bacterium]|nr:hypothetical protein [Solirubrobacteraceae bacterium]
MATTLPHIDEHSRQIDAPPAAVWAGLQRYLRSWVFAGGFHVEAEREDERLALAGRHPFSRYELIFEIDDLGAGRSRLRAITNAAFPGPHGRIYRMLVIGSGGHRVLMRRMLGTIAGRSRARR